MNLRAAPGKIDDPDAVQRVQRALTRLRIW